MRNALSIKMTMVAVVSLATAQVNAEDLNIAAGQTQTLAAGTYAYDSVYIAGTLIADGDVNFVVTGQLELDVDGLIRSYGADGANGLGGRESCSFGFCFPASATNGANGQRGRNVSIDASIVLLQGTIDLHGGRGGRGGKGRFDSVVLAPQGANGGRGGHSGSLDIHGDMIELGDGFQLIATGGAGGNGGHSVGSFFLAGGAGGNGGNGGDVTVSPLTTFINRRNESIDQEFLVAGGQGGLGGQNSVQTPPFGGTGPDGIDGDAGSIFVSDFCDGDDLTGDTDADGVCDSADTCHGFDDAMDSDADLVPDGCDVCEGFDDLQDCNANGIADGCDLAVITNSQDFEGASSDYVLNGTAVLDNDSIRLTEATTGQLGSVVFEPVSGHEIAAFEASFDFRMGGGNGADGISFALFDANAHDNTVLFGEGGGASLLSIGFDTFRGNAAGGNHVMLKYDGMVLADEIVGVPLNNNQWHHAEVEFDGVHLTLALTLNRLLPPGLVEVPFDAVSVPGFVPTSVRYGFGARTGGSTDVHRIDNILFVDTSNTNDCNANGLPDQCDTDGNGNGIPDDCEPCGGVIGDVSGDGVTDVNDMALFVAVVLDPAAAQPGAFCAADTNQDGDVNGVDIRGFFDRVLSN